MNGRSGCWENGGESRCRWSCGRPIGLAYNDVVSFRLEGDTVRMKRGETL